VVYLYIADAHDNQSQAITGLDPNVVSTFGPGEAGYVKQLAAYNTAFGKFFDRLAKDGITKDNTLFVITADENDHFVGGPPSPANCDGIHTPCTYAKIGEIDGDLSLIFATEFGDTTPFNVHFDDAPTFYINGNPGQMAAVTRKLERESGKLLGFDPLDGPNGGTNHITQALADQAEQDLLHMVTFDPNRTPNFILFANPDYFLLSFGDTSPVCAPAMNAANCFTEEGPSGFAWNHGDFQNDITHTWLGVVGPGVKHKGRLGGLFTDHTDIRPTILSVAHLKDDYSHDGRTVFEILDREILADAVRDHEQLLSRLAEAYKQINAPRGLLGRKTLTGISTKAIESDDATYAVADEKIREITAKRNEIAEAMLAILEDAVFDGTPPDTQQAERLIDEADKLLDSVN
jgi:arylsulfatase A-like enzyme